MSSNEFVHFDSATVLKTGEWIGDIGVSCSASKVYFDYFLADLKRSKMDVYYGITKRRYVINDNIATRIDGVIKKINDVAILCGDLVDDYNTIVNSDPDVPDTPVIDQDSPTGPTNPRPKTFTDLYESSDLDTPEEDKKNESDDTLETEEVSLVKPNNTFDFDKVTSNDLNKENINTFTDNDTYNPKDVPDNSKNGNDDVNTPNIDNGDNHVDNLDSDLSNKDNITPGNNSNGDADKSLGNNGTADVNADVGVSSNKTTLTIFTNESEAGVLLTEAGGLGAAAMGVGISDALDDSYATNSNNTSSFIKDDDDDDNKYVFTSEEPIVLNPTMDAGLLTDDVPEDVQEVYYDDTVTGSDNVDTHKDLDTQDNDIQLKSAGINMQSNTADIGTVLGVGGIAAGLGASGVFLANMVQEKSHDSDNHEPDDRVNQSIDKFGNE